jgi:NAD(P)-dependent dehydrogenase (short-subunit alcohol dehydrogenase family)
VITSEGRRITLDTALDFLGGLDILVNNAGGMPAVLNAIESRFELSGASGDGGAAGG